MKKRWFQSRAVWLGILTCAIGILEVVHQYFMNGDFSPSGITMAVSGALGVVLRFLTSDSIA